MRFFNLLNRRKNKEPQPQPSPEEQRTAQQVTQAPVTQAPDQLEAARLEALPPAAPLSTFGRTQSRREYDSTFDESITEAGKASLRDFPDVPPAMLQPVIELSPKRRNHATMNYGFVQYNLKDGVQKGETANGYGDDFCQVHAITRVFVVDKANHLIAMCTPQRYMCYMANQTYVDERYRFKGNIFQFGGAVVATPRWAMRGAAWNILRGQNGEITRIGDRLSITGSEMVDGEGRAPDVLMRNVRYSGASWVLMDKWMEQARAHKISIVSADTGITDFCGRFDADKTLPLVIREDEADMLMADPVTGLTVEDDRFDGLRKAGKITASTKALQFRGGWYAPYSESGITRIMRLLKFDEGEGCQRGADGTGPYRRPEKAYSDQFVFPATKTLWVIGGVEDNIEGAAAVDLGSHGEMEGVRLTPGSGGFNREESAEGAVV